MANTSTVLFCSAAVRDAGNRFFCAIGQDELPGYTFSAELSPTSEAPATHYACHTMATPAVLETLVSLKNGAMGSLVPANVDWSAWNTTEADVLAFGQSLAMFIQGEPQIAAVDFYNSSIAASGLQNVVVVL